MMPNSKPKKLLKKISLNDKLFDILKNNPPQWWKNLKYDKEIIIDVRTNKNKSYIDCYYNGGCILKKLDCDKKGNFKGEIHYKYIPIDFGIKGESVNYDFTNQQINFNHIKPAIPNLNHFDMDTISLIKKQVEKYYPNNSEKGYQYRFIQKDPYFIDSEFQYNEFFGNNQRIDLVRLDRSVKKIVFVELKKMNNKELFNGRIEKQLEMYKNFISYFKQEIFEYYLDLSNLYS
jgi:hypothetical protein